MANLSPSENGIYKSNDGYLAVALGNYYGNVGDKFKMTLDTGKVLKVIRADTKSDKDVINQCYHASDGSILEFIIDTNKAMNYYGGSNGLPLNGNFNNTEEYKGAIIKVEKYIGK